MKITLHEPCIALIGENHPVTVLTGDYRARREDASAVLNTRACIYLALGSGLEVYGSESSWRELALLGLCQITHES